MAENMAQQIKSVLPSEAPVKRMERKLEAVELFVEEQYKDGVCLWCEWRSGQPIETHCCWVGALDCILCLGALETPNHKESE